MAASSTYREMQDWVLGQVSKSDATTRNRIKTNLNLGYYDFVLRELWPFREVTGTLSTVAGTQEYVLSSNFSDMDAQNILDVALQGTTNRKLAYWPFSQLRAANPDFDLVGTSVPDRYYLKAGKIGFYPAPNDVYSVAIDYYSVPTEMSADSDTPALPIAYREALNQYALGLEHDFNTDPDLAQKAMNRYEQIVTLARNNLLTQPVDTESFKILGPMDSKNWTDQGDLVV